MKEKDPRGGFLVNTGMKDVVNFLCYETPFYESYGHLFVQCSVPNNL